LRGSFERMIEFLAEPGEFFRPHQLLHALKQLPFFFSDVLR
jgi:hypothetical protein